MERKNSEEPKPELHSFSHSFRIGFSESKQYLFMSMPTSLDMTEKGFLSKPVEETGVMWKHDMTNVKTAKSRQ